MENVTIQIKQLGRERSTPLPRYMTQGASGMDLFACLEEEITLVSRGAEADPNRNLRGNSGGVRRPGEAPERSRHPGTGLVW